jgi:uncharacterized repeat protein (TIGR03803 family)
MKNNGAMKALIVAAIMWNAINGRAVVVTDLHEFTIPDGAPPSYLLLAGNIIYGTSPSGGTNLDADGNPGTGSIWRMNVDGSNFTNLYFFSGNYPDHYNSDGVYVQAVIGYKTNVLFGIATGGGAYAQGTLFELITNSAIITNIVVVTNGTVIVTNIFTVTNGPEFHNLHDFYGANGNQPHGKLLLVQSGFGDVLFGTTRWGGGAMYSGNGSIYRINVDGSGFTKLHGFADFPDNSNANADGVYPMDGLIVVSNILYGTATGGGTNSGYPFPGSGTVYRLSQDGIVFELLHSFSALTQNGALLVNGDGAHPVNNLVSVSSNTLYGVTSIGGANGYGTLYKIVIATNATVLFTNMYDFNDQCSPSVYGELILSGDSIFGIGNWVDGSGQGGQKIYRISTNGTDFIAMYDTGLNREIADIAKTNQTFYCVGSGFVPGYHGSVFTLGGERPFITNIVANMVANTNYSVTITTTGSPGFLYSMLACTSVPPVIHWVTISTNLPDLDGLWRVTDSVTNGGLFGEWTTNLVYADAIFDPFNQSAAPTNLVGTNILFKGERMRFYRAALLP